MFEKGALLMICCDISTKSFENVPIACGNCTKPIEKNCMILTNFDNWTDSCAREYLYNEIMGTCFGENDH